MARRIDSFWWWLLLIVAVASAGRVLYVYEVTLDQDVLVSDQIYYNGAANRLAAGLGFVEPFAGDESDAGPAADHPPLTAMLLAPVSWLAGTDEAESHYAEHRVTMAVLGAAVVLLLGLAGRALAGDGVGLLAAAIGAAYPNLWANDGLIMSETLAALLVTACLLLVYRLLRAPTLAMALGLGAVCGLAALTRAELVLLTPALVLPAALAAPGSRRDRVMRAGAVVGLAVLVVAPWVGFNLARFDEPTFISTNDGIALLGSNCDKVYYGTATGLTSLAPGVCLPAEAPAGDQSTVSAEYRADALDYAREHAARALVVAGARVGRTFGVYRPRDMVFYNQGEGRPAWVTRAGMWFYYPLAVLAVVGAIVLRRRAVPVWPLLVPVGIVVVASAVTYGQTRFRVAAEPSIVVLAAVGIAGVVQWLRART